MVIVTRSPLVLLRKIADCVRSLLPFGMSQHHPSALRNRVHIAETLSGLFQSHGIIPGNAGASSSQPILALEFASGTGAHVEKFAEAFPEITWQPSEYVVPDELSAGDIGRIGTRDGDVLDVIDSFGVAKFPNVLPACALDLNLETSSFNAGWPKEVTSRAGEYSVVFASNVMHITPLQCTHGVLEGASEALRDGGILCVYGPFKFEGKFTGDGGNERFDKSLRQRCAAWGYRDVEYVAEYGKRHNLVFQSKTDMPANNFLLCFKKV